MSEVKLNIKSLEEIETKVVEWLWFPYIAYGKITIIQGDPGCGKTTLILQLASLLTKGELLPLEESKEREPITVIYQSAEDSYEDTIKPRLEEAGADCSKICFIDESVDALSMTDSRLVEALETTNAKLLILDPIQGYLGGDIDMHRANEIRPVMKKLGQLAEEFKCAIVLIGHVNKGGSKSIYRGLGSIDFVAATRSLLFVGKLRNDPDTRVIVQDKNNLAYIGDSISFKLTKENGFSWGDRCDIGIEELLNGEGTITKSVSAVDLLKDKLSNGIILSSDMYKYANEKEISKRTLDTAKAQLGVKSIKEGGKWYWKL